MLQNCLTLVLFGQVLALLITATNCRVIDHPPLDNFSWLKSLHRGIPPNRESRDRPRPPHDPVDCLSEARYYSQKKGLMGGWQRVDLSDESDFTNNVLLKLGQAAIIQDLNHHQNHGGRQGPPPDHPSRGHPFGGPPAGGPPPDGPPHGDTQLPTLDLANLKIEPVEEYTQIVSGIKMCALFTVSQCKEQLCQKPVVRCTVNVYDIPWLTRGQPNAGYKHVRCLHTDHH